MKVKLIISYLILGIITTVVNILGYYILTKWLNVPYLISNAISWSLAIIFAYITNKYFVFNLNNKNNGSIGREFAYFFCSRILSGTLDMGFMYLLVTHLFVNDIFSKVLISIFVIGINFFTSKYIIFI